MFRHLNDAVLRRYVDEPDALLSYEKEHLVQCLRCRRSLDTVRSNARTAMSALSDAEDPYDAGAVRAAILERAQGIADAVDMQPLKSRRRFGDWRAISTIAAAAVVTLLLSYAPFRAYAENFLTIFEPREVTPISVTRADINELRGLPELNELGTVHENGSDAMQKFSSLAAARAYSGQTVLRPSYLPASVAHSVEYRVNKRHSIRFTFDERKARASAARKHYTLPAPPAGLDGATLTADVGPIVVQSYGVPLPKMHGKREMREHEFPHDGVLVVQLAEPAVHSTSISANTIISYLLSLPSVPEDVKAQIRAIRDPASTLPVPVAIDKSTSQAVDIHGARGLLIGDNTGVGSVIVWVSGGKVYSVAGGYSADEMTKVANSMTP